MYARITHFQLRPETMRNFLAIIRDSALPVVKQQPGFTRGLILTDRQHNEVTSITLWNTEADLQAGVSSGYLQAQIAKGAHLVTAPPRSVSYEVVIDFSSE